MIRSGLALAAVALACMTVGADAQQTYTSESAWSSTAGEHVTYDFTGASVGQPVTVYEPAP